MPVYRFALEGAEVYDEKAVEDEEEEERGEDDEEGDDNGDDEEEERGEDDEEGDDNGDQEEDEEEERGEGDEEGDDNGDQEEDEDDICISAISETCQIKYLGLKPNVSSLEENSHLPPEKEKQILVDPVSLKQSVKAGAHESSAPVLPPLMRPKYVSSSLPCSTTSSPQSDTRSIRKWCQEPTKIPHPALLYSLARQHSAALSHFAVKQGIQLRRSKSCGEGRSCAPSDELDILSRRLSIPRPESQVQVLYECSDDSSDYAKDEEEQAARGEESFRCGALCLLLPGLSRKKQVPSSKDEREENGSAVSHTVSLEKFECGSWSAAAIVDGDDEDDGGIQTYFDLPLELMRCSTNDAHSPVKTAFVFEGDLKGVLKKSTSRLSPRKSHESSNRHVRFSTSAPTSYPPSPASPCITPRLRKAREDFNAFLEAQSA